MTCTFCGSHLHPTSHCPKTAQGQSNRLHLRCTYCGGRDHDKEACCKRWSNGTGVRVYDK